MTALPWAPITSAPDDGRLVLVWDGADYRWASFRVPAFHPDETFEGKCWCEDRLPMVPPPTHWLDLSPPDDSKAREEWVISAHCWRRGPEGSIACYTLEQRKAWSRCFEHEGSDTISDEIAQAVTHDMVRQLAAEVYPKLLYAVRSAQGFDPDGPNGQMPDA